MDTKKERDLYAKGYNFTGIYTRDLEEAKNRAAQLREDGFFAQVVIQVSEGRIYNTTGYSVFSKAKGKK